MKEKKTMKLLQGLLFGFLILSFLIFIPGKAEAAESTGQAANTEINTVGNGEYAITSFRIEMVVNEDNTFFVREYITAYFSVEKHGFERLIPLRNQITRLDGTKSANRARITVIEVQGDKYSLYKEEGNQVIRIGNPNKTVTGSKDYIISYVYDIGKDPCRGYDEFYFNLVGYDWDTTISGIEFKITMPKEFDNSKLGFSSGRWGSTDNSNVIYKVKGNVITGRYSGVLNASKALTIRLELPDGYFSRTDNNLDFMMLLAIILPIIFAGITFLLWFRYGRDEIVVETVEFYPPQGYNSAEIGFLYRGKAEKIDVVSLLIYLADKGYIAISEYVQKSSFSNKKDFKISKIKEYDGNDPNERLFLDGLFNPFANPMLQSTGILNLGSLLSYAVSELMQEATKRGNKEKPEIREVTLNALKERFYRTLNAIIENINRKENKEIIFEKSSLNKNIFVFIMAAVVFALISFNPISEFGGFIGPDIMSADNKWLVLLAFPSIGFSVMLGGLFGIIKMRKVEAILFGVLFAGTPFVILILPVLIIDQTYLLTYVIGTISAIGMFIIAKYMTKRTAFGTEILGKIRGFKNFLETAEKPRLEALVMQNPSYFYNILPFTYVLGLSDKWIKKFESIALVSPDWYSGTDTFSSASFGSFVSQTMKTASSAMSSRPSSDGGGGGGGSGGGSSGGGSGGGGGRSW
jgi:uncharacterized membrane protein YgcG